MNNENSKNHKQTLQEVLSGEEPTEEFLQELRMLEEAENVSDSDLTRQAMALKPAEEDVAAKTVEPNYKNNESNFSTILIAALILVALYWFTK